MKSNMEPLTIHPKMETDDILHVGVGNTSKTGITIGHTPLARTTVLDVEQLEELHYWLARRINEIKGINHDDSHETDYGPYCLTCAQLGAVNY